MEKTESGYVPWAGSCDTELKATPQVPCLTGPLMKEYTGQPFSAHVTEPQEMGVGTELFPLPIPRVSSSHGRGHETAHSSGRWNPLPRKQWAPGLTWRCLRNLDPFSWELAAPGSLGRMLTRTPGPARLPIRTQFEHAPHPPLPSALSEPQTQSSPLSHLGKAGAASLSRWYVGSTARPPLSPEVSDLASSHRECAAQPGTKPT